MGTSLTDRLCEHKGAINLILRVSTLREQRGTPYVHTTELTSENRAVFLPSVV